MVVSSSEKKSNKMDKAGQPVVIKNKAVALEKAADLLPGIRERSERADQERRLPDETIQELKESGLFGITTPRIFGGSELGFSALVEVTAELASACGSTGWVYGVLAGHNWMMALFPEEAQREVFSDPGALTSTVFRLNGKTVPEKGGYRLTGGEGRFCTGIDYADWVIVGNAVQKPGSESERCYLLVPKEDVEIVDDWYTMGMRGTCSRSIRIENSFIPEHRIIFSQDANQGTTPGARLHSHSPMYMLPFPVAQPFSLVGIPLGLARGALNTLAEVLAEKFSHYSDDQIGEQGMIFGKLTEADADIEAVRSLVLGDCAYIDAAGGFDDMSRIQRTRIQRNFAYAARICRRVVTSLFEGSGGSAIYNTSTIQRFWRDGNAATAHTAFNWVAAAGEFGRAYLDLPPSRFVGPRR